MSLNVQKISRVISQLTKDLRIRIHLKLVNQGKDGRRENFHNVFSVQGNKYLKLDLQSFLTLEFIDKEDDWSQDKSIVINERNIFQITRGVKECIDAIYDGGIFAVDKDKNIVIYADMVEKHTVQIYNIGGNQRMVLKPTIVYDENETSYEGATLYINKSDYSIDLPIDVLESMHYILNKIDLFLYSQALLNYYMMSLKEEKIQVKEVNMNTKTSSPPKTHPLLQSQDKKEDEYMKMKVTESNEKFFQFDKRED